MLGAEDTGKPGFGQFFRSTAAIDDFIPQFRNSRPKKPLFPINALSQSSYDFWLIAPTLTHEGQLSVTGQNGSAVALFHKTDNASHAAYQSNLTRHPI